MNFSGKRSLIAAATLVASVSASANRYTIVDLGFDAEGVAINSHGDVAAEVYRNPQHGIVIREGRQRDLQPHTLMGGLNDRGYSVGYEASGAALLWSKSGDSLELPMPADAKYAAAYGLNNHEYVVGSFYVQAGRGNHCFLWTREKGTIDISASLPGAIECQAFDINSKDQITGSARLQDEANPHAFLYDQGKFTDLGLLEGTDRALASAINRHGTVIGSAAAGDGLQHGFLWNGALIDLDVNRQYLSTQPFSINSEGEVVGSARLSETCALAARFSNAQVIELRDEVDGLQGWKLDFAESINDAGVILVNAHRHVDGKRQRGLLELVPQADGAATFPVDRLPAEC